MHAEPKANSWPMLLATISMVFSSVSLLLVIHFIHESMRERPRLPTAGEPLASYSTASPSTPLDSSLARPLAWPRGREIAEADSQTPSDSSSPPGQQAEPEPTPIAQTAMLVPSPITPQLTNLHFGVVDMVRLFNAHPYTKAGEEELNALREAARIELDRLISSGDRVAATNFRETKEKELQKTSDHLRQKIASDLEARVKATAARRHLDFVLDTSGKSLNNVPVVLHASGFPDVTDEIVHDLTP
jgi:Skp family chaperone for outer membrane proteins